MTALPSEIVIYSSSLCGVLILLADRRSFASGGISAEHGASDGKLIGGGLDGCACTIDLDPQSVISSGVLLFFGMVLVSDSKLCEVVSLPCQEVFLFMGFCILIPTARI